MLHRTTHGAFLVAIILALATTFSLVQAALPSSTDNVGEPVGFDLGSSKPASASTLEQPVGSNWYFAEGSTQPPFDTWFLVQNPTAEPANVRFTFFLQPSGTIFRDVVVGPTTRFSLFANEVLPNQAFSTLISSPQTVFAERAMYVGYDGTDITGIPAPNRTWLFAEGATTPPFDTWLLLQNPNTQPANVTITYLLTDGAPPRTQNRQLPALSRTSIFVNSELPNAAFSTRVDSDVPIVAERAMYRFPGNAATDNPGVNSPNEHWYFADGNTTQGAVPFDSFLLLMNPNETTVGVGIVLRRDDGNQLFFIREVPPRSRLNVFLNEIMPNARFGIELHAGGPIIAERSQFFNREPRGAISTQGANDLLTQWLLPEGSTQAPFTEIIAMFNPTGAFVAVHLDFQLPNGQVVGHDVVINPEGIVRLNVRDVVPDSPVSTKILANSGIVVERLMFFSKLGSMGGTDTIGIPQM